MSAREYVCVFANGQLVPMSELVRCRDCKHVVDELTYLSCHRSSGEYFCVMPDGFCAWGIRKEDA